MRTRINSINFVKKIVKVTRPLGVIILVKFHFFSFGGRKPHLWADQGEIWQGGADVVPPCQISPWSVPKTGTWVKTIPAELPVADPAGNKCSYKNTRKQWNTSVIVRRIEQLKCIVVDYQIIQSSFLQCAQPKIRRRCTYIIIILPYDIKLVTLRTNNININTNITTKLII